MCSNLTYVAVACYFKEHVKIDSVVVHLVQMYKSTSRQMPRSDKVSSQVRRDRHQKLGSDHFRTDSKLYRRPWGAF